VLDRLEAGRFARENAQFQKKFNKVQKSEEPSIELDFLNIKPTNKAGIIFPNT